MAVWMIRSLCFWIILMCTHPSSRCYHHAFGFGLHYDDSGEDYYDSRIIFNRRNYETFHDYGAHVPVGRSVSTHTEVQRVQKEEQRRISTSLKPEESSRTDNSSFKIVNKYPYVATRTNGASADIKPDGIVFPGPIKEPSRRQNSFVPEVPSECINAGYCETLPVNYPVDHIAELLKSSTKYYFNIDELEAPEIVQRFGPPEEEELCRFTDKIMYPTMAQNREDRWYYIVNNPGTKRQQGFRVETCHAQHAPCSPLASFPYGYEPQCKQKYILRLMYAIDNNGQVFQDSFKVPSCCSCVAKRLD